MTLVLECWGGCLQRGLTLSWTTLRLEVVIAAMLVAASRFNAFILFMCFLVSGDMSLFLVISVARRLGWRGGGGLKLTRYRGNVRVGGRMYGHKLCRYLGRKEHLVKISHTMCEKMRLF